LELLVGISAVFSRLGSCITSLISGVSTLFTIAASVTATALFAVLTGLFNTTLKGYEVHATLGTRMLAVTWIAVVFSLASGLFWALSSCCCSGDSAGGRRRGRKVVAEKAPYTYERVNAPYLSGAGGPGAGVTSETAPLYQQDQSATFDQRRLSDRYYTSGPDAIIPPAASSPAFPQDGYEPFRHRT